VVGTCRRVFHVKHSLSTMAMFLDAADGVGLSPTEAQRELLVSAATWLASLGRSSAISGYDTPDEALARAMSPALAYFALAEAPRAAHLADLGAGNGAIGATIAILERNLLVDLVDRARRAYTACEILAARLRLANLRARHLDARDDAAPVYDVVVFRALAPGPLALASARRLVAPGGFIAAYHRLGDPSFGELGGSGLTVGTERTTVPGLVVTGYQV